MSPAILDGTEEICQISGRKAVPGKAFFCVSGNGLRPLQEMHDCGILISVAVHGYACTVFFFKEVKL
mgnify:CR=1 FL=1